MGYRWIILIIGLKAQLSNDTVEIDFYRNLLTEVRCGKSEEGCALFRTAAFDKADIIFVNILVVCGLLRLKTRLNAKNYLALLQSFFSEVA